MKKPYRVIELEGREVERFTWAEDEEEAIANVQARQAHATGVKMLTRCIVSITEDTTCRERREREGKP